MKILFVSSECAPFAKTGGLGDVVGALPKALAQRGHDVRVVMPLYGGQPSLRWDELPQLEGALTVPMGFGPVRCGVRTGRLPGRDGPSAVRIYLLEHKGWFNRPFLYGSPTEAYGDNLDRFAFLSRGALTLCYALNWIPDVVHAHDWQAALTPVYLNTVERDRPLHAAASVLTIHNLAFQGELNPRDLWRAGLGNEQLHGKSLEHFGALNLMKGGLWHATFLSTVSPSYAREIQQSAFGCGLDGVLRERAGDLRGILNGLDDDEWDPARDALIAQCYSRDDLSGKVACKAELQREVGLPSKSEVPLIAWVGRFAYQKGIDVVAHALMGLVHEDAQFVFLGTGDLKMEQWLAELSARHPQRLRIVSGFDPALAHRIEAGADFFLMPSRFEPCGLNQMYSQRYGTLPIVRATGGLADTVRNYNERTGSGTGFAFSELTPSSLYDTVRWALDTWWKRRPHIDAMRREAMGLDWSWSRFAGEYEQLYKDAYARRRGHPWRG
ncbi:MAG: glycogen synthase GlgA [Myxococcales bacterium]|nr:glycogen synthase GlgA [Myxococcales bacterium]